MRRATARPNAIAPRAYAQIVNGNWEAAQTDMREAIRLDPIDGSYRAELGWLLTGWFGGDGEIVAEPEELEEAVFSFGFASAPRPGERRIERTL